MKSWHLGLSTSGHDPALAIVDAEGRLIFAEASERFVQDKRAWGIAPDHVSHLAAALEFVGFDVRRNNLSVASSWAGIKTEIPVQVSSALLPATDGIWIRQLQAQAQRNAGASLLRLGLRNTMPEVERFDHHLCHAVAACHSAPFTDGHCLVIDGEGEVGAVSLFAMQGRCLKRLWRSWGGGSLGTFYAWITGLCGFDWRLGEEWKVMGLAAFGKPQPELVRALRAILIVDRGRLRFADDACLAAAQDAVASYRRAPHEPIMKAADLAASGQQAYAQVVDDVLGSALGRVAGNLVLTGGCALNSSYNGSIHERLPFAEIFVPTAPGDDGNAIGAAMLSWMKAHQLASIPQGDGNPFLGVAPNRRAIAGAVGKSGWGKVTEAGARAAEVVADRLAKGQVIGIMRGRAEFGPRALGHRSILADPRPADMKDRINRKVKGRETYRPFAPVIPRERVAEWFSRSLASPYMSFTLPWRETALDSVPAVVHEDGTGRLQTVDRQTNPWMSDVIDAFEKISGVPIVLNTSFNIMGKPIVNSVEDALAVMMTTGLDGVLLEDVLIEADAR